MKQYYTGKPGFQNSEPVAFDTGLRARLDKPEGYLASDDLVAAVNTAMTLGQPLLLNGEPGVGKSGLAHAVAHELNLGPVKKIVCKADMRSGDLFYSFDHIWKLYDNSSQGGGAQPDHAYITFHGLGAAIMRAAGADHKAAPLDGSEPGEQHRLDTLFPTLGLGKSVQSVVLIDEIDKASRDVPNDILDEIDKTEFSIPEMGVSISTEAHQKPLVIITSNSEKALPGPFLRRCIFYSIEYPSLPGETPKPSKGRKAYTMENIVLERVEGIHKDWALLQEGLLILKELRNLAQFQQPPSPAEFMNWLLYMKSKFGQDIHLASEPQEVIESLKILLKNETDRKAGQKKIKAWLDQQSDG